MQSMQWWVVKEIVQKRHATNTYGTCAQCSICCTNSAALCGGNSTRAQPSLRRKKAPASTSHGIGYAALTLQLKPTTNTAGGALGSNHAESSRGRSDTDARDQCSAGIVSEGGKKLTEVAVIRQECEDDGESVIL